MEIDTIQLKTQVKVITPVKLKISIKHTYKGIRFGKEIHTSNELYCLFATT